MLSSCQPGKGKGLVGAIEISMLRTKLIPNMFSHQLQPKCVDTKEREREKKKNVTKLATKNVSLRRFKNTKDFQFTKKKSQQPGCFHGQRCFFARLIALRVDH